MDGFLVIDKPEGPTSQKVVSRLKRALQIARVGHTGTLDPLATGVLPIALGEATKVISYLDESQKIYQVTGRLGVSTTTFDAQGEALIERPVDGMEIERVEAALQAFLGERAQVPPVFSAIKVQGKPLYRYARAGQSVSLPARTVCFHRLNLLRFEKPFFQIEVACSRGTYVRSLVHDLGEALGCGAHVTQLRRLATGPFHLQNALDFQACLDDPERARREILSIERCLPGLPRINLESKQEAQMIQAGVPLQRLHPWFQENRESGGPVLLKFQDCVLAIVQGLPEGGFRFRRVLQTLKSLGV